MLHSAGFSSIRSLALGPSWHQPWHRGSAKDEPSSGSFEKPVARSIITVRAMSKNCNCPSQNSERSHRRTSALTFTVRSDPPRRNSLPLAPSPSTNPCSSGFLSIGEALPCGFRRLTVLTHPSRSPSMSISTGNNPELQEPWSQTETRLQATLQRNTTCIMQEGKFRQDVAARSIGGARRSNEVDGLNGP